MSFLIDPNMAANQAASQDLLARSQAVQSLSAKDNMTEEQRAKGMRDACEGFEAVFIQKMWEQMRASLPKDGFLKGKEEEYWQGMYDQELGKSMASAGGIGLADMMMEQLDRNNTDISDASRGSVSRRNVLPIPPASLLPAESSDKILMPGDKIASSASPISAEAPVAQAAVPAAAVSIYDGEAVQPEAPEDPVHGADQNSDTIRQTLDELASLAAAQQRNVINQTRRSDNSLSTAAPVNVQHQFQQMTGQAPYHPEAARNVPNPNGNVSELADAESGQPVVTTIRYQTNLPPSQRKASPFQNNGQAVVPRQPLSTGTPTGKPVDTPEHDPSAAPVAANPVTAQAQAPAAKAEPVETVPVPQAPVDILAGITPRFVPERFRESSRQTVADLADNAASRPVQAGGPSFRGPQAVTRSVALGNPAPPRGSMSSPVSGSLPDKISSGYGWRLDPFTGQRAWHTGVDIKAEPGEAVRSAMPGTVVFAGQDPELGNLVVVEHGDGLRTLYGHNRDLQVEVGQSVSVGTEIATAGASGRAAGTHVHFEVRRGDLALNPEPLLRQQDVQMAAAR